jgi:hypothetical protein
MTARWCALHPTQPLTEDHRCNQCEAAVPFAPGTITMKIGEPVVLGRKDDSEKDRWDLLPWEQVGLVVKVLTRGAKRYGEDNWQQVKSARRRYMAACVRHLIAWWRGEVLDPDDGLPHLAHAICCLLFLMWFDREQRQPAA